MPTELAPNGVAQVTVSATNTGETAADADVAVTLPAGTEADSSTGWTLMAGEWQRTVAVAPGATQTVTLGVRNTNPGPSVVDTSVGVRIATGGVVASEQSHGLTLKAPKTSPLVVSGLVMRDFVAKHDGEVWFTITNTGNTTVRDIQAQVLKNRPMKWVDQNRLDWWLCNASVAPNVDALCRALIPLAPGQSTTLRLVMTSPEHTENGRTLPVVIRVSGEGLPGEGLPVVESTVNVPVAKRH